MKWVKLTVLEAQGLRDDIKEALSNDENDYLDLGTDIELLETAIDNAEEEEIPSHGVGVWGKL